MNKKLILGCLAVFVIIAVSGGIVFYMFVFKPLGGYVTGLVELGEVSQLNERVERRGPYAPPRDNVLTRSQVQRFVAVQESMRSELGNRYDELERRYERLSQRLQDERRELRLREMLAAWRDVTSLIVAAKRAQVEALNRENFSLEEYEWVRARFYEALGAEVFAFSFEEMARAAEREDVELERPVYHEVPEENRRLVAPYADDLDRWVAFGWFGL